MLFISELFEALKLSNINYCVWSGTTNIEKSLTGEKDIDLLVDREDISALIKIVVEYGFKRRESSADKVYPGVEDYIGFETSSGKIHHLHIHYHLIFGRKYENNYVLPFHKEILSNSIEDDTFKIRTIAPEYELIILLLRIHLKIELNFKKKIKSYLRKPILPKRRYKEIESLLAESDSAVLEDVFQKWFGETDSLNFILNSFKNGKFERDFLKIFNLLKKALTPFRRYQNNKLELLRSTKEMASKHSRSWLGGGGIILSFVGCDGSGKSSTVKTVNKWLSQKVSVKNLYMGIPKESFELRLLKFFTRSSGKLKIKYLKNIFHSLQWIFVARTKYLNYLKATQLKNQGYTVLLDRYPLKEFWQMETPMDGPRLPENTYWGKKEREYYDKILFPENLVILYVTEEESVNRKPEHASEKARKMINEKISGIDHLISSRSEQCLVVDTVREHSNVIMDVKQEIWNMI